MNTKHTKKAQLTYKVFLSELKVMEIKAAIIKPKTPAKNRINSNKIIELQATVSKRNKA